MATFNILGTPNYVVGDAKYNAVKAQLARIDSDIVGFQELRTSTYGYWTNLAAELDYPYTAFSDNGPLSGSLYNGYFSRYPILSTHSITSPAGAVELTRAPFRIVVEVPDAQRPLVLWNMHHKASGGHIDNFRRAIEAYRIVQDIDAYLATNPTHLEYVFMGDMNDDIRDGQTAQYTSQPSGAPASYVLGSDITFPVAYATFPSDRVADAGEGLVHMPAYWEGTTTPITRPSSSRQLDYIYLSPEIINSPLGLPQSEVYYSEMDLGAGLPKVGLPLASMTSSNASDHLPIFVDIQMADYSSVLPVAAWISTGEMGGPFDPETATYTLTETNAFDTDWTALADVNWLTLSNDLFTLSPFIPLEVDVELNALAELLIPGTHEASISFYNETTDLEEIREIRLTILDFLDVSPENGLTASGDDGGPFAPDSIPYSVTNKSPNTHTFTATANENWISVIPSSRTLQGGEVVEVTVSLNANATVLPIGTYQDTVIFSNQTTGLIQEREVSLSIIGSLCSAVDNCSLSFTTGGNADWIYQTSNTSDGVDAAISGDLTHNEESWMETVISGPVNLSFEWKVSSESGFDYLELWVDGVQSDRIAGEIDWQRHTLSLTSGIHTVRWSYSKDGYVSDGEDMGWVDQISLDYLSVTPTDSWNPSGVPGGPFTPSMQPYALTNTGLNALQWTVSTNVPWLTAAPVSGELAAGEGATVEVSLNPLAQELASGTHAGSITFSNSITGDAFDRLVSLSIQDSLVITPPSYSLHSGFVGGPYPTTTNAFWVSNSGPAALSWSLSNSADWVETDIPGGTLEAGASTNIQITFTSLADALPSGYSHTPFLFSNETAHLSQSRGFYLLLEEPLGLTMTGGISAGPVGGPFDPITTTFTLTNLSPIAQSWTALSEATWLTFDATHGILPPNSSTQVVASLNAAAEALGLGGYTAPVIFSNLTSGSTMSQSISLYAGIEFCDAIEACDLDWTFGGDAAWTYQTNTTQDGVDAAASGTITQNGESWMETSVTGPGDLTFQWKISSESYYDYLELWVDGVRSNWVSGETDWLPQTLALTSGPHTVRWRYVNYYSLSGEYQGWVDTVEWSPRTAMGVPIAWYERFGLAPGASETWDDLDLMAAASGAPNWFQYLSGLDPTEPDDLFVIHSIQRSDGQPTQVTWWGGTNGPVAPYVIESTTNLFDNDSWTEIAFSPRVSGLNIWTNPVTGGRMEHYRIQATLNP